MKPSRKGKFTAVELDWETVNPRYNPSQPIQRSSTRGTPVNFVSKVPKIGEVRYLNEIQDIKKTLRNRLQCSETALGHPVIVLSATDAKGMVEAMTCTTKPSSQKGYARWQKIERKLIRVFNKEDSISAVYTSEQPQLSFLDERYFERTTNVTMERYRVPEGALGLWRDGPTKKPTQLTEDSIQILLELLRDVENSTGRHWTWNLELQIRKKARKAAQDKNEDHRCSLSTTRPGGSMKFEHPARCTSAPPGNKRTS